ncbi:hypothetical protein OH76DRAFT_1413134 [Lentinus brumalis]|uniref:Methyltransferase type 11 domain-containing protein n=1 Tax=Lentinus brumalis TaxID=2498619 RepID=A0A371CIT5_9APHY|nr:hypothetical protein OH76DRAFT_1413134 [Polyporus brumalis]
MDLPSDHFTHVITNFAFPGFAEPRSFLKESFRVLRPNGITAMTRFESVGWYPIAAAAVARIPGAPRVPPFDEFSRNVQGDLKGDDDWTDVPWIEEEMRKVGFEDVQSVLRKTVSKAQNAEEYLKIFGEMNVIGMAWSEEEKERVRPHYQAALVEEVKSRFGDGEITLEWGAWCITARVPASKT